MSQRISIAPFHRVGAPDAARRHDAIVIGAGMAGLSAARALSGRDVLVLEAEAAPGGRTLARAGEPYWRSLGAHMVGGPESRAGRLIADLGLEARPIRSRLAGLAWRNRRLLGVSPAAYPLLLPATARERLGLARMGAALRIGAARFAAAERRVSSAADDDRRSALLRFDNDRTLADAVGPLPPTIAHLMRRLTERTGADPAAMSAGHGWRSFGNVWTRYAPGRHVRGGTARLADALAAALPGPVLTGWRALEIRRRQGEIAVIAERAGERVTLRTRAAVIATPPDAAHALALADFPDLAAALARLRWGAFLTAAVETRETGPMPWDGTYAIATPDAAFSVVFDMASSLREGPRRPGGSLTLFCGALAAQALSPQSDTCIEDRFRADLQRLFPEVAGLLGPMEIRRWPVGAPFAAPGSAALVESLGRFAPPLALAGDYLEFPNIESAIASGERAAAAVSEWLAASPRADPSA